MDSSALGDLRPESATRQLLTLGTGRGVYRSPGGVFLSLYWEDLLNQNGSAEGPVASEGVQIQIKTVSNALQALAEGLDMWAEDPDGGPGKALLQSCGLFQLTISDAGA